MHFYLVRPLKSPTMKRGEAGASCMIGYDSEGITGGGGTEKSKFRNKLMSFWPA